MNRSRLLYSVLLEKYVIMPWGPPGQAVIQIAMMLYCTIGKNYTFRTGLIVLFSRALVIHTWQAARLSQLLNYWYIFTSNETCPLSSTWLLRARISCKFAPWDIWSVLRQATKHVLPGWLCICLKVHYLYIIIRSNSQTDERYDQCLSTYFGNNVFVTRDRKINDSKWIGIIYFDS